MLQDVKKFGIILLLLPLAACATTDATTAVVTVEKPTLMLPNVDAVRLNDIEWHVVNKNAKPNGDGSVDQAFQKSHSDSLFALSPKDYEDLAINQANIVKSIRQYQAQIRAYKKYYESTQNSQTVATPQQ